MTPAKFDTEARIERCAQSLPPLAKAQEAVFRVCQELHALVIVATDGEPPPFPLSDRYSCLRGLKPHYATLLALLYRALRASRPTDARTGRGIGQCDRNPGFRFVGNCGRADSAGRGTGGRQLPDNSAQVECISVASWRRGGRRSARQSRRGLPSAAVQWPHAVREGRCGVRLGTPSVRRIAAIRGS